MRKGIVVAYACWIGGLTIGAAGEAVAQSPASRSQRVVLVELFTSHGCNLCPSAEDLMGRLVQARPGGPEIVPLAFHVDYFNKPWKDPFSDPQFSAREAAYSRIYTKANDIDKEAYLYLTPLVMVDGRDPLVGSNEGAQERAEAFIRRAAARPPEVGLEAELAPESSPGAVQLEVRVVARRGTEPLLLAAAVYEDGVATAIDSGENEGTTYVGRFVVRSLDVKEVTPRRTPGGETRFELRLPAGSPPEKCGVAVFAQSESTGYILQAMKLAWPVPAEEPPAAGTDRK